MQAMTLCWSCESRRIAVRCHSTYITMCCRPSVKPSLNLSSLLELLVVPEEDDAVGADIVCETAVIIGALSSAGALTLRPLLGERVPARLVGVVRTLPANHPAASRMLPPILRGLRNVLGATADAVWGHMWGVGAEQKVVGTGLVGDDVLRPARVRKGRASQWRADAVSALGIVFEPANRTALLSLIDVHPDNNHILLPLYQLLARLIALPSHREAFAPASEPFVIHHLLETLCDCWSRGRRPQPRLLEAALDLLAALVKGQPNIATVVREWDVSGVLDPDDTAAATGVIGLLVQLLETGPPGVRIAVANCLTNIIKADKGFHARDRVTLNLTNLNLLNVVIKLLRTEAVEERVKLCFVLGTFTNAPPHTHTRCGPNTALNPHANLFLQPRWYQTTNGCKRQQQSKGVPLN